MLSLTLMNHTFEIPCEPEERERLMEAATLLEDKLDQIPNLRGESKVLMTALNLCYDYLQLKQETLDYTETLQARMDELMQASDNE
ncbi:MULTISPECIES: cell division protein ZapA [Thiomicrorhabdus]|uniref:Cell division protein ZapA n=1 Tax=Thiomicrorhabdus heinhorstiae TaxID=2748010 RepID=A0ABS0BWX2_9GAMM|nr:MULTISPECIES: cell division protein ZapA [Thiomicrorhabdus]MBF6058279.1 cell division protein ZapA [Thiomicrorhabdus heinhorstiae]